jgi:hypothetical protein
MTNVKWLESIEVLAEPFGGYQQARGYRFRASEEDDGEPLRRMRPRALMIPPGIPEFMTRRRTVRAGACVLEGRAWSGGGEVVRVEVSTDGGGRWSDGTLGPAASRWAWRAWQAEWHAEPGDWELCCRATDAAGAVQPSDPSWNVGGYANNAIQRVPVTVV